MTCLGERIETIFRQFTVILSSLIGDHFLFAACVFMLIAM